jgi:hypothetical protein
VCAAVPLHPAHTTHGLLLCLWGSGTNDGRCVVVAMHACTWVVFAVGLAAGAYWWSLVPRRGFDLFQLACGFWRLLMMCWQWCASAATASSTVGMCSKWVYLPAAHAAVAHSLCALPSSTQAWPKVSSDVEAWVGWLGPSSPLLLLVSNHAGPPAVEFLQY